MSKTNVFENELLAFIFNGTAISGLGASLYVSLHTADPGEAGTQATNEAAYTGYQRVEVARTAGGWNVVNNVASPAANVLFPEYAGGPTPALTHFGVGTSATGAGKLLYKGPLNASIPMGTGVTPGLNTDTAVTED